MNISSPLPRRPRNALARAGAGLAVAAAAGCLIAPTGAYAQGSAPAAASAPSDGHGWIRFGHFSNASGPVTVKIDGRVVDADAGFETVTPYQSVTAGTHAVSVTSLGGTAKTVSAEVTVSDGGADTVAALPGPQGLVLDWFSDNLTAAPAGDAKVRVLDAVPTQSALSGRLTMPETAESSQGASLQADMSSSLSLGNAPYGKASAYTDVPAGSYDVVVGAASGKTLVTGTNWPVAAGTIATLVALESKTGPTLEALSDAAGATSAPTGAMATGFGGAAALLNSRDEPHDWRIGLEATATAILLGGCFWFLRRRKPRYVIPAVLAAVVTLAAADAVVAFTSTPARRPPLAVGSEVRPTIASHTQSSPPVVSLAAATVTSATTPPTALRIPSIGVDTRVVTLGRTASGAAQVPTTTTVVGWYSDGPVPGQPGPAVILGHVDSYQGPGVFFRLSTLQAGARIEVVEGSNTVQFEVQQVDTYGKADFPTDAVFGPVPDRALRLITCGGPFDRATGHYTDNVVVYATEVEGG